MGDIAIVANEIFALEDILIGVKKLWGSCLCRLSGMYATGK